MSFLAHLDRAHPTSNRRASPRRTLRLQALGTTSSQSPAEVIIHDLSRTGLLLETTAELAAGERIDVELPEAGAAQARVVWSSGRFFGCKFERPIPPAALSSAILGSPPADDPSDQVASALLELQTLRNQVSEMTEHLGRIIDRLAPAGEDGA